MAETPLLFTDHIQRHTYWTFMYPCELLARHLLLPDGERIIMQQGLVPDRKRQVIRELTRRSPVTNAQALHYVVAHADAGNIYTLHIQSAPHYLVFDLDLRLADLPKRPACGSHPPTSGFCADCWRIAQFTARWLFFVLCDVYALAPPMTVFSGGNGLHVWFRVPPGHILANRRQQALLLQAFLLQRDVMLSEHADKVVEWALPLLRPQEIAVFRGDVAAAARDLLMPQLDGDPTLWPPAPRDHPEWTRGQAHMIKAPFSLHAKTGAVAVPLCIGPNLPVPIPGDRAQFEAGKEVWKAWCDQFSPAD